MTRYLYVLAEAPRTDLTMVSFAHAIVEAEDNAEAYDNGRQHFIDNPDERLPDYRILNDYVVML